MHFNYLIEFLEQVSEFEAEQEIIRVQKLFVSDSKKRADLVVPGRRIVKQGPVFRKSSSSYCLFLFNDLVVLAKKVFGSKFEPKTQVRLFTRRMLHWSVSNALWALGLAVDNGCRYELPRVSPGHVWSEPEGSKQILGPILSQ
jgi:hypothetical protein